MKLVGLTGFDR